MKIGLIGDLHLKERLGYADYIKDRRLSEKAEVLSQIETTFKNHDLVIFMGDNLNSRNNQSEVIKEFVDFVERFSDKQVAILAGNHEKYGDGRSAIDFMKHIKRPWTVVTNKPTLLEKDGLKIVLLPFMSRAELKAKDDHAASLALQGMLPEGDMLFAHHAISGMKAGRINSDMFQEPMLDKAWVTKRFKLTAIGHIHESVNEKNVLLTGSIFNNEVGELSKSIWTIDTVKNTVEEHRLRARSIFKIVDPSPGALTALDKKNILKVELTQRGIDLEGLKKQMAEFDGHVLIERYQNERQRIELEGDALDYSVEKMLELYAKSKKLDPTILLKGYDLIRN